MTLCLCFILSWVLPLCSMQYHHSAPDLDRGRKTSDIWALYFHWDPWNWGLIYILDAVAFSEMYKQICVPSNVLLYLLLFLICNVSFSEAALSRDLPKIPVIDFRFTSCTVGLTSVWLSGRQCENQSVMLSTKTFHSSSKQRTHRC